MAIITTRANPRTGGGNIIMATITLFAEGQPPDGRGKLDHYKSQGWWVGPTPGRAGETFNPPITRGIARANPRTGGGNAIIVCTPSRVSGQPPDGRGKQALPEHVGDIVRPTPGRAGET